MLPGPCFLPPSHSPAYTCKQKERNQAFRDDIHSISTCSSFSGLGLQGLRFRVPGMISTVFRPVLFLFYSQFFAGRANDAVNQKKVARLGPSHPQVLSRHPMRRFNRQETYTIVSIRSNRNLIPSSGSIYRLSSGLVWSGLVYSHVESRPIKTAAAERRFAYLPPGLHLHA
jgi:hypothetical protein